MGDATYGDDGYCVVGCADIHKKYKHGNSHFCSARAIDMTGNLCDDVFDSALMTNDGEHSTGKKGAEDEFCHSHDAVVCLMKPFQRGVTALQGADKEGREESDDKHYNHIYSHEGKDYDT